MNYSQSNQRTEAIAKVISLAKTGQWEKAVTILSKEWRLDRKDVEENLKGSEAFTVPLYQITSSEKLKELVIDPLPAVQEREEGVT